MTRIPVLADAFRRAWPKYAVGGQAHYTDVGTALTTSYDSDAHFAAYSVPNVGRRLGNGALDRIVVPMVLLVLDVDCAEVHGTDASPPDAWWLAEREKLAALLAAHPNGFVYATRGGYRVVYVLQPSVELADDSGRIAWRSLYVSWCAYVARRFGIQADQSAKDWTRLFRLPHVVRNEGGTVEERETVGDAQTIGLWSADLSVADLAAGQEEARPYTKAKSSGAAGAGATSGTTSGSGRGRGRLVNAFRARGWLGPEISAGKWAARCPWEEAHSIGATWDGSTVMFDATAGSDLGWFHCSHGHCSERKLGEVIAMFKDEEMRNGHTNNGSNGKADYNGLRSGSYLSVVQILEQNIADVLGGRKLEYNQMLDCPEIGRRRLVDADVSILRSTIERSIQVASKSGAPRGLACSNNDMHSAVLQVAHSAPYHPVVDYLRSLRWDQQQRLEALPRMFGAEDTPLNRALLRRWFISAVARPLAPGCKMDTALILIGPQGIGKSTAFRILASDPLFSDSAIDVHSKDAYLTLRRSWVLEMSELESVRRADVSTVKAFLTSSCDTYRASYGRLNESVPRAGVIVGSTNNPEFLGDESGSRRFWPLVVSQIDRAELTAQRDQLWAEAVALYDAGEQWWLLPDEELALQESREEHAVSDAWSDPLLAWMEQPQWLDLHGHLEQLPRTTAKILEYALGIGTAAQDRSAQNRVAAILRRAGWEKRKRREGSRVWRVWVKV